MQADVSPSGNQPEGDARPSDRRSSQSLYWGLVGVDWLIITLASVLLITNLHASTPLMSANDRSRWATVWSLVERGTYQIDEIDANPAWSTIDKVLHEGHLYSSKPPLLSTIAAGIYWGLKNIGGYDLLREPAETTHAILLILNTVPMVVGFVVFARLVKRSTSNELIQYLVLAFWCFGTLVTGYSTTFNNHSLGAVCLVFAIGPLLRLMNRRPQEDSAEAASATDYALVGFWSAAIVCCELPAALLGAIAFGLAARADLRRALLAFAPAAAVPFVAYFITNAIATGGWKPFYSFYGTDKYLFTLNGIPSYWLNPRGLDRNLDGPVMYFWHCTFGHHGIFSLSPIFLLSLIAWMRPKWWRRTEFSGLVGLTAGLTVVVLGFYLTRTANYNYGGNTYGLRWIIWLSPLWILSLIPTLERMSERRSGRFIIIFLFSVSAYSAQAASANPWGESWLYHRMRVSGWIDYSDPAPELPFKRPVQTWFPELPSDHQAGSWIEYESPISTVLGVDAIEVLRLSDQGTTEINGRRVRNLFVEWNPESVQRRRTLRLSLDEAAFETGATVDKQIVDFKAEPPLAKSAVITFLRGIPYSRPYHGGNVRYLKTKLRADAYTCYRAATQVIRRLDDGSTQTDRCDVWLTSEVPFGVLQFELTQFDGRGDEVTKRRFSARQFGKK